MNRFAIAVLVCLALSTAAQGAVIYVDADAAGADDGTSWADAYTDLQGALTDSSLASGDEIWVAEGTYVPGTLRADSFLLADGVGVYGGFAGTESARDERDWATNVTILSGEIGAAGNADNCYHVVTGADDATLDGFTVTGGNADESFMLDAQGGGMYNYRATGLTVANCAFSGNRADSYGGGMSNWESSATVTNCRFSGNAASSGLGGGMFNLGSPTVTNCTFWGNTAIAGGGMFNMMSSPTVVNCLFSGNAANEGGGMRNYDSSPTLTNCTFSGNTAGGMYNGDSSSASVINCVFWGDSGTEIVNSVFSSCTVRYSDIGQVGGFTDGGGNINADPLFVSAATGDLHLQAGSPCIDAADGDAAPPIDIEGSFRQDEPGVANTGIGTPPYADMGAYEFQSASGESMTVLTPNGGETWDVGTQEQVSWTSAGGTVVNVRVELSRDGGTTWEEIVASTDAAAGACSWTVTAPLSANCLVRVSDAADGTPVDASDAAFTIREAVTVSLSVGTATEGDGSLAAIGTVSVQTPVPSPLIVTLSSDDTTEATVPASVTIPAGLTSATFDVTVVDDTEVDGDQTVSISASASLYVSVGDSMLVQDNESQTIAVILPVSATEGDGTLVGAGTVSIPGTWTADLVIDLSSDDTTELDVPPTVTIFAGDTSAAFDFTVVEDAALDFTQTVTVTPTLAGWVCVADSMDVLDNEATITVTLPANATEGDGTLAGAGTVSIPLAYGSDLVIGLSSDDVTELDVPATVTIPAGNTSASFNLIVVDDGEIDGTQSATVTPALADSICLADSMDVLDNETQTLTVTLPADATEGQGTLVGAGTVSIPGTYATDLVIDLSSADTTEITIPATVTILQGDTSAAFDLTVETDGAHDGTQTVTVTASATGWTGISADMEILDIDPAPKKGGCASGAPGAALAFCILIPWFALRRRRAGPGM